MIEKATREIDILGRKASQDLAQRFVRASISFSVDPLPYEWWRFTVKSEVTEERLAGIVYRG